MKGIIMNKKIILFILLILCVIILSGCGMQPIQEPVQQDNSIFKLYQHAYGGDIIVDTETNVMYWESMGAYNSGSLTLLVDAEGKPKLYNGDKK